MSRPYFETKVIKISKKKRRCPTCGQLFPITKKNKKGYWVEGTDGISRFVEYKKGNWVNGENLDKIKFPVPCRYGNNRLGIITSGTPTYQNYEYILHNIDSQSGCSALTRSCSLRDLIKNLNIHILKGKIIIYEEEK